MKIHVALAMSALLLSGAAARAAPDEERLAREIEGREAGEPVDCIDTRQARSSRIIDRTAIIFEAGRTIYVNRPRSGAESLRRQDVMVIRPTASRLCSIDTVRMVDSGTRTLTGIVFLGQFVPYRRPPR